MTWTEATAAAAQACRDTMGVPARIVPFDEDAYDIQVIWESPFELVETDTGARVAASQLSAGVVNEDLQHELQPLRDRIEVAGRTYEIVEAEPDGEAMTRLILQEVV